jgi:Cu-processing system ATP-binding protein
MRNTIDLRGVARHYGPIRAVDGVDLAVAPGEALGLIGHNGAGKTTLFKLMLGLERPTAGTIEIDGIPAFGARFRDVRRRIGYMPESTSLYPNLTGFETLHFFARLKGADVAECTSLLGHVGLAHAAVRPVRQYSKGMAQRLLFAQALLGAPRILFLDEPTHGLDPSGVSEFYAILGELRADGITVVLTSHVLSEVEQRVDRLALMSSGKLQAVGTVQALRAALDLPLAFDVCVRDGGERDLRAALTTLSIESEIHHGRARFHCARNAKLAVLAALSTLGSDLVDVNLKEPTLEDVFLGYRRDRMSAAREAKPSEGPKNPSTRDSGETDTRSRACDQRAKEVEA